jgi:N-6 DNA methylase
VNTRPTFVAHVEPAKSVKPGQRALHDPPRAAEAAAVRRPALRELRVDPASMRLIAMRLRIVSPVALDQAGFAPGPPGAAAQRRNGVDEGQQLGDVVPVRTREQRRQRDPTRFGENVMFRPRLTAIGWVRSSFFPPRSARTEALSTTARARSNWPRRRSSASNSVQSTPDADALPSHQPPPEICAGDEGVRLASVAPKDAATSGLARMNMILHNNPTALVVQGNTLADSKFKDGDTLKTFDYVVASPAHRQLAERESATAREQFAALEEPRFPTVLAVEPKLAGHARSDARTNENSGSPCVGCRGRAGGRCAVSHSSLAII